MYYSRDYYYEISLDKYYNVETYLQFVKNKNKEALVTEQDILFSTSTLFRDQPKKYLKKKYGNPNYEVTHKFPFGVVNILFYKIFLGTQKVRLELHFFQSQLFFFNYTFSYLKDEEEKNLILKVLSAKYELKQQIDPTTHFITDKSGNAIMLTDSIALVINYLCNVKSQVYLDMEAYADRLAVEQEELKAKKQQELFDRL